MKSPHQTALFLVVFFQNAYRSDNYFGSLFKVLDYLFGIAAGACHFHSLINSLPAHIYLSAVNVVQLGHGKLFKIAVAVLQILDGVVSDIIVIFQSGINDLGLALLFKDIPEKGHCGGGKSHLTVSTLRSRSLYLVRNESVYVYCLAARYSCAAISSMMSLRRD